MKKRLMSIALAMGMFGSCLATSACGGPSGDDGDVEGKTTIRVATFNGGLGMKWLETVAAKFEKALANKSFETDKTGVAVKVVECPEGSALENKSLDQDVYLTEAVDYYFMQKQGKLANISDVASASLSAYGDSNTIAGKLNKSWNDYLTAKDGNYYAIPFYEGFHGFIYDADMFELKGWYFDESGNFTKTNKSTGVDGKAGTYDDGLPKTYAQFSQLFTKMRGAGVTPFTYAEESVLYFISALSNYWANYEGIEEMQLNWSFDGEADIIESFNGDGTPVLKKETITSQNYAELQKQPGKYYALKFAKEILLGNEENYESASDFKTAQFNVIGSCLDGEMQESPVAMVIDGTWFENEAYLSGTFDNAAMLDMREDIAGKDYKKTRKFAFMPIPMVDDSQATLDMGSKNADGTHKQTLVSANDSYCFISSSTTGAKLEVSKEFLKFLHAEEQLKAFTTTTSITRPYTYTVSESERAEMSYFGRSVLEMKESSNIVYPYSASQTFISNTAPFMLGAWAWKSKVGGETHNNPFEYFRVYDGTTQDYFEGLYLAQR